MEICSSECLSHTPYPYRQYTQNWHEVWAKKGCTSHIHVRSHNDAPVAHATTHARLLYFNWTSTDQPTRSTLWQGTICAQSWSSPSAHPAAWVPMGEHGKLKMNREQVTWGKLLTTWQMLKPRDSGLNPSMIPQVLMPVMFFSTSVSALSISEARFASLRPQYFNSLLEIWPLKKTYITGWMSSLSKQTLFDESNGSRFSFLSSRLSNVSIMACILTLHLATAINTFCM